MKLKKCSFPNCSEPRMKRPGNTSLYFKYCQQHQIDAILTKLKDERIKDKAELEKVRKNGKKTPRELFYSSTAWRYFSKYVLLYYADEDLNVRCCTDPNLQYRITDRNICVGHFVKVFDSNSSNYSTAFDFRNVGPQSIQQNIHFGGNQHEMKKWVDRIHGEGTSKELEAKSKQPFKLDKYTLDIIAEEYKAKFKELLISRVISNPWKK